MMSLKSPYRKRLFLILSIFGAAFIIAISIFYLYLLCENQRRSIGAVAQMEREITDHNGRSEQKYYFVSYPKDPDFLSNVVLTEKLSEKKELKMRFSRKKEYIYGVHYILTVAIWQRLFDQSYIEFFIKGARDYGSVQLNIYLKVRYLSKESVFYTIPLQLNSERQKISIPLKDFFNSYTGDINISKLNSIEIEEILWSLQSTSGGNAVEVMITDLTIGETDGHGLDLF